MVLGLDGTSRAMYKVVASVAGAILIAVIAYGLTTAIVTKGLGAIGETLVTAEFPFPPYFAKPISYLSISAVAFWYALLRLWESKIADWPKPVLSFLQLFGFVVAFASAYEVLYNFMVWGALLTAQALIQAKTLNPNPLACCFAIPWNLDFATKFFSALFVISGYAVYFLRRITGQVVLP
jgi:hypothetical protein